MTNKKVGAPELVLEALKAMPNLTSEDLVSLIPERSVAAVFTALTALNRKGRIIVTGEKDAGKRTNGSTRKLNMYALNPDYVPGRKTVGQVKPRKRKLQTPTPIGLQARLDEANKRIAELEEWKAEAIRRFPNLAVPPLVLKARKLVADEVRSQGDTHLADLIASGHKDSTVMLKVAIRVLEEADA